MEVSFCSSTPLFIVRPRPKSLRCNYRMSLEPSERPPEQRGAARLLRAPEAIAAMATVAFSLFRDVLRGDGSGVRARLDARLRAHSTRRARITQLDELREEVTNLFEEAKEERGRIAYYDTLAERCMAVVTYAREENLLGVLADAVRNDSVVPPARGSLKDAKVEQELYLLLDKARKARAEFRSHVKARDNALKEADSVDLVGAESEAEAARQLIKIRRADLLNMERSTKEALSTIEGMEKEIAANIRERDESIAETKKLRVELERKQNELDKLRSVVEKGEVSKNEEEVQEEKVRVSAAENAYASEAQLRRLKKEIEAANQLAKKIVDSARVAVKKSEEGDTSAVEVLGDVLKKDIVKAEREMKKLQRRDIFRARTKKGTALKDVLDSAENESGTKGTLGKKKRKKGARKAKKSVLKDDAKEKREEKVGEIVEKTDSKQLTKNVESEEQIDSTLTKESKEKREEKVGEIVEKADTKQLTENVESEEQIDSTLTKESGKKVAEETVKEQIEEGTLVENLFDEAIAELLEKPLGDEAYAEKVHELAEEMIIQDLGKDAKSPSNVDSSNEVSDKEKDLELGGEVDKMEMADALRMFATESADLKRMDEAMAKMTMEDALMFREAIEDLRLAQEEDKKVDSGSGEGESENDIAELSDEDLLPFVEQTEIVASEDDGEDDSEKDIADLADEDLLPFVEQAEVVASEDEEKLEASAKKSEDEEKKSKPVRQRRERKTVAKKETETKSEDVTKDEPEKAEEEVKSSSGRFSYEEDVTVESIENNQDLQDNALVGKEMDELLRVVKESDGVDREGVWAEPRIKTVTEDVTNTSGDTPIREMGNVGKAMNVGKDDGKPRTRVETVVSPGRRGRPRKQDAEKAAATRKATNASLIEAQTNQATKALKKRKEEMAKRKAESEELSEDDVKAVRKRGRQRKVDPELVIEKRKRGRPRKSASNSASTKSNDSDGEVVKPKRGRPRKKATQTAVVPSSEVEEKPKRKRGRPRKVKQEKEEESD